MPTICDDSVLSFTAYGAHRPQTYRFQHRPHKLDDNNRMNAPRTNIFPLSHTHNYDSPNGTLSDLKGPGSKRVETSPYEK